MFIIGNVVAIVSVIALSHLRLRIIEAEEAGTDSDSSDIEASVNEDEVFEISPDMSNRSNISPKFQEENFTSETQHIQDKSNDTDTRQIKATYSLDHDIGSDEAAEIQLVRQNSYKTTGNEP